MTWSSQSFSLLPKWFVVLAWSSMISSCVSLRSVSLTAVPAGRDSVVQAKESEFIVFGIATNNDFVDDVARTLARQCQGGRIQGILTKHFQTIYIYWLLEKRTVEARGYCSLPIVDAQKRAFE